MNADALALRRTRLLRLAVEVDQELAATEAALRIHGVRPGRPRVPYTMTPDEARAAHDAYNHGGRAADVLRGNAEYQRRWRRGQRNA